MLLKHTRFPLLPTLPLKTNHFTSLTQTFTCFPPHSNINDLCTNGQLNAALLLMSMQGDQVECNGYNSLLKLCAKQKAIRGGQRVQAHMIKTHYFPLPYLQTRLLVMYTKCDSVKDARRVLDRMSEPNVVSWTAVISNYCHKGCYGEALDLFKKMLHSGTPPNDFTFSTVLTSCSGACWLDYGRQVHSLVIKSNFASRIFVGSSLLDMYSKADRIHDAIEIFKGLSERDVVSCTAIITGYAQLGLDEEALELFRQLLREGMQPNYVTFTSVLTALSGLAALDLGRQVHNRVFRSELPFYVVLQNSLIDMYSKCGSPTYSRRIFDRMSERTIITWNSMLIGYGKHGLGREVVELYCLMRKNKEVKPNNVTLLAVLSGCSHGGLVDEGFTIFNEMINETDEVKPGIEHYGCVVDLFGRAGRVDKALEFIKVMKFEPTAAIWSSLLGACRAHGNVFVGEYVARRLFEIEPENAGNYVVLSNLYASVARWDDVRNVRKLIDEKAVTKVPGRSWIKLDHTVHSFHAGDWSHPRKEKVLLKVKELSMKIKEAGYVHDLSCVLHDVDEEQKERILLGHSEKLAIAFGLIGTSQGLPIRVMKNLRICVDCHNFAKYVSIVYEREISLRDKNRFHNIVRGICSCGDYW